MINGFADLTVAGWIHTVLASVGILVGAEQVLRRRRDVLHRRLGYLYVASMLIADVSILTVYRFNGHVNAFHAGAIMNVVCIAMALQPMLSRPRPRQWRIKHYLWMCWSYVGLLAAALTELIIRTQPLDSKGATIIVTMVASTSVAVMGAVLIQQNRPAPARA